MNVYLQVMKGIHQGRKILLPPREFVIGRSADCELRSCSTRVSKRHCVLRIDTGWVFVRDLGSSNGTRVNSKKITGEDFRLHHGDILEVGPLTFAIFLEEQAGDFISDEEQVAALLLEIPDNESVPQSDSVLNYLAEIQTVVDVPAKENGTAAPYRPATKHAGDNMSVNSATAARAILEQYRKGTRAKGR